MSCYTALYGHTSNMADGEIDSLTPTFNELFCTDA